MHLFGRVREPNEMYGITKDLLLCRASDAYVHKIGQDGFTQAHYDTLATAWVKVTGTKLHPEDVTF